MNDKKLLLPKLTTAHRIALIVGIGGFLLTVAAATIRFWELAFATVGFLILFSLWVNLSYSSILARRLDRHAKRAEAENHDNRDLIGKTLQRVNSSTRELQDMNRSMHVDGVEPKSGRASSSRLAAGQRPVGSVPYWAAQLRKSPKNLDWFVDQAKKTRSTGARDVLVHTATAGKYTYQDFALALETSRIPALREQTFAEVAHCLWEPGARALARLLFSQRTHSTDLHDALSLYEIILFRWGKSVLDPIDYSYYADLLVTFRRYDDALTALRYDQPTTEDRNLWHELLRLNAINPGLPDANSSEAKWLQGLNNLLAKRGFAQISLAEGPEPAFYRLKSTAPPVADDMTLVSIVMPIYEPDDSTDKAVESILAQSWTNIELIMVDDGSPRENPDGTPTHYAERLLAWAERDGRIRLILNEENKGAYWARNVGYEAARGTFVTVADKDDWHHPQKIAFQAQDLVENPTKIANMTNWVRTNADLRFLFRWGPDRLVHPSFASIMYRREEVKRTLGYWDNVRKSGDNEFRLRLQTHYKVKIQAKEPVPLAFSLLGEGNLTSQDFGLGFEHDGRKVYRNAYERWHKSISQGASPYMPMLPEQRPFPAPNDFLPDKPVHLKFQVIFVSEFGLQDGNCDALLHEIKTAVSLGLNVGIITASNSMNREAARRPIPTAIGQLIDAGAVRHLTLADELETELLVIRWPSTFQVTRDASSDILADSVVVVANVLPYENVGKRRNYDVSQVARNVKHIFGIDPVWAGTSNAINRALSSLVPPESLLPGGWKDIQVSAGHSFREPSFAGIPRVGRHAHDAESNWPDDAETIRQVFSTNGSTTVSILGGAEAPIRAGHLTQRQRDAWEVHEYGDLEVDEYLEQLDFFVHFPHRESEEDYQYSVLEAMSKGVVCILPPQFRASFGDAALYCKASEVRQRVIGLWTDPVEYKARRRRAFDFITAISDSQAYLARLESVGVETKESAHVQHSNQ